MAKPLEPLAPELWAGIECTVNRVGDEYFDQLERSGHSQRAQDLDLIAELGIRTLRFPALWERVAPTGLGSADWAWTDERLGHLRRLGIRPIAGLVHHGSGPRDTSLVDPAFPDKLASYALAFAKRYPWVEHYTPVNEPLTTARFAGLYGHWYPHGRDPAIFATALLTQCRATVLAMRAVREVNPAAQLVQTEDLGRTFSTPALAYQAEFENERRWLTWDLLCGRVDADHPMWHYLRWVGIPAAELDFFLASPCPPDILGINHYLTSERFLDSRIRRYPPSTHGGNERQRYADVEAVRVRRAGPAGPRALLQEVWARYGRPFAVTEVHLGCTREEQLRWLAEVWEAARQVRDAGAELRAVTAWSLLGAFDWHCLVTRNDGCYEPGAFDLRAARPRPTALAGMIRALATTGEFDHPVLDVPGWWHRPGRLLHSAAGRTPAPRGPSPRAPGPWRRPPREVVITGGAGPVGQAFARVCAARGIPHRLLQELEMDPADPASIAAPLERCLPWAVIDAAACEDLEDADHDPGFCGCVSVNGSATLAAACATRGIALLTFSSPLVFDGSSARPYVESDAVRPASACGACRAAAEARVLDLLPSALVVRTGPLFGPWNEHDRLAAALRTLAAGDPVAAAADVTSSPTYVPDLVHASLDLLVDGERGIWHLANPGAATQAKLVRQAAQLGGIDPDEVEALVIPATGRAAAHPAWRVLGSERATLMPPIADALRRFFRECPPARLTAPPELAVAGRR